MRLKAFAVLLSVAIFPLANSQTHLDLKLGPLVKLARLFMSDVISPRSFDAGYRVNLRSGKVQQVFDGEFFCDVNGAGKRSETPPSSVHKLTPGDVDVVGAMGDSLTAANGAFAVDGLQTTVEGRGVSWSIGGRDNWRKFLTLPNLIKVYNPKLYGYSEAASSLGFQRASKFNVAEPTTQSSGLLNKVKAQAAISYKNRDGDHNSINVDCPLERAGAISFHTIRQAKNLVKRMRSDPRVDVERHWKIVTIMIGSNDFCLDICYYDNQTKLIDDAERNMIQVLRILRENLPRTLVNVVIPVDVGVLFTFKKISAECKGFHYLECPCLTSLSHSRIIQTTLRTIRLWKKRVERVVDMAEFHSREDFEVTLVKFTKDMKLPEIDDNTTDYTFLSKDCFHLSQKGHSVFAVNLWNQMLTAEVDRKNFVNFNNIRVKCPTSQHPYFRTRKN